jgi:hypothetical protein
MRLAPLAAHARNRAAADAEGRNSSTSFRNIGPAMESSIAAPAHPAISREMTGSPAGACARRCSQLQVRQSARRFFDGLIPFLREAILSGLVKARNQSQHRKP